MSLPLNKQSRSAVITGSVIKSSSVNVPNGAQMNCSRWGNTNSTRLRLLPGVLQERDLLTKHASLFTCMRTCTHTHTKERRGTALWRGTPVTLSERPKPLPWSLQLPQGRLSSSAHHSQWTGAPKHLVDLGRGGNTLPEGIGPITGCWRRTFPNCLLQAVQRRNRR